MVGCGSGVAGAPGFAVEESNRRLERWLMIYFIWLYRYIHTYEDRERDNSTQIGIYIEGKGGGTWFRR